MHAPSRATPSPQPLTKATSSDAVDSDGRFGTPSGLHTSASKPLISSERAMRNWRIWSNSGPLSVSVSTTGRRGLSVIWRVHSAALVTSGPTSGEYETCGPSHRNTLSRTGSSRTQGCRLTAASPAESVSITPVGCASRRAVEGWCTLELYWKRAFWTATFGLGEARPQTSEIS